MVGRGVRRFRSEAWAESEAGCGPSHARLLALASR